MEIEWKTKNLRSHEAEVRGFISLACSKENLSHTQFKEDKKRPKAILESWHEIAHVEANSFFSFKFK